jgi:hypothetical protein
VLTLTSLSPRALEIVADGALTRADVSQALDERLAFIDAAPGGRIDILADLRGTPDIQLA